MFVPNFAAISHVNLVLEPENLGFRNRKPTLVLEPTTKVWRKKRSQSKAAEVQQKIFHTVIYVLRYPLIPTNPVLAAMRFFSFFFFLNLVRYSSPKLQNIEM